MVGTKSGDFCDRENERRAMVTHDPLVRLHGFLPNRRQDDRVYLVLIPPSSTSSLTAMSTLRTFASQVTRRHQVVVSAPRMAVVPRASLLHIEAKLDDLGITLPTAPAPKANYNIVCHAAGNMLYISGHLPVMNDGSLLTGRIGPNGQTVEHGYAAARQTGLNIISTLKEQLGDLDRVKQVVKVRWW